jgi:peptidyl-prolyl cis-trans isomerase C
MPRRLTLLFATALVILGGAARAQSRPVMRDDDVVARVNGTPIYRKAVREVVQEALSLQDSAPTPATIGKLVEAARDSLIAMTLLYQESQARGIEVSDAAVDEALARSKAEFPDAQAFQQALAAKGVDEAALRQETRQTMAVNLLLEEVAWKDVRIDAAQIRRYYETHRQEFKHPAQVRVSRILVRVPEHAPASEREAARERADALLARLHAGAEFAQLAREHSQDAVSAANGGDIGYIARGEMDPAFERQAAKLAPGAVSGVVRTPYGYEIIKVTARRGVGTLPLDEVQDRIRSVLVAAGKKEREAAFVAQLRRKSTVELLEPTAP